MLNLKDWGFQLQYNTYQVVINIFKSITTPNAVNTEEDREISLVPPRFKWHHSHLGCLMIPQVTTVVKSQITFFACKWLHSHVDWLMALQVTFLDECCITYFTCKKTGSLVGCFMTLQLTTLDECCITYFTCRVTSVSTK